MTEDVEEALFELETNLLAFIESLQALYKALGFEQEDDQEEDE